MRILVVVSYYKPDGGAAATLWPLFFKLKKHLEQILSYVCVAPQCREMPDRLFSPAAVGEMGKVTI